MHWKFAIFLGLGTAATTLGCGSDPIVAMADHERAEEHGTASDVQPPPGQAHPLNPGQAAPPQAGDPGQPDAGSAIQPPPGAPDQPRPGIPEAPTPGVPGDPQGQAATPGEPADGPTVTLKGRVRYAEYESGKVRVDVFDGDQRNLSKHPGVVGWAELTAPGSFEITVRTAAGEVWLSAFNDANGNGAPDDRDPTGHLEDNPVQLSDDTLTGLVIDLEYNPRPEDE